MADSTKVYNTEIASTKSAEKEFEKVREIFQGKENESNWEERDGVIKELGNMLNSTNVQEYKEAIVRGFHSEISGIINSIHSLRTSVAITALSLISNISITLGSILDHYTIEIIVSNLMKCSVVTKKLIATKVEEVTIIFLSHTPFSPKIITMLCKSMTEKNVQLRQLCCTYIQTILKTHGSQESVRTIVEKSNTSFLIDNFLKKELVDASPSVRNACRSLYWTYYQYWPEKAKKVYDVLDLPTQKALGQSKPTASIPSVTSPARPGKTPLLKRSATTIARLVKAPLSKQSKPTASISSATSPARPVKTPLLKRSANTLARLVKTPLLKRSSSERSSVSKDTSLPLSSRTVPVKRSSSFPGTSSSSFSGSSSLPAYPRPTIPKGTIVRSTSSPVAPKRMPTLSKQLKQKPGETKATSTVTMAKKDTTTKKASITVEKAETTTSTPAATLKTTSTTMNTSTLSHKPSLTQRQADSEAMSLLNMLKDNSSHTKSKGIRLLAERMKDVPYEPTLKTVLPNNVPERIEILPLLMDLLSQKEFDSEIHQTLMCWECITGIFTGIFSLHHYGPTLIIADQQQKQSPNSDKKMKIWKTYSKGLQRLKLFLKRNDTLLAERLLSVFTSVKSTDQKLIDASIKHDLRLNPSHKESLEVGLLKWMNELLQDYIGLPEDEDEELLNEGAEWLNTSDSNIAEQWFDTRANIQSYVSFVIDMLLETNENDEKYPLLCCMIRNLKIANQKAFENKLNQLNQKQKCVIKDALIIDSRSLSRDNESGDLYEADFSVPGEAENAPPTSPQKRKLSWSCGADEQGPLQKMSKKNGDTAVTENAVSPVQNVGTASQKRKVDSLAQESTFSNKRKK